jgi:hypothetical protein
MERDQFDTQAALAAVRDQRRAVANRLVTLSWYHPILGVLLGGLVAAQASQSFVIRCFAAAAVAAGAAVLALTYRRLTGIWVSGYRRGSAGRVTALLVAVLLVGLVAALALGWPAAAVAGVLVAFATVVLGRRFDSALRKELRG